MQITPADRIERGTQHSTWLNPDLIIHNTAHAVFEQLSAAATADQAQLFRVYPEQMPDLMSSFNGASFKTQYARAAQREHMEFYDTHARLSTGELTRRVSRAVGYVANRVNYLIGDQRNQRGETERAREEQERLREQKQRADAVAARIERWRLEIWFDPKVEDLESVEDFRSYLADAA